MQQHLSEEQLVELYYEAPAPDSAAGLHLEICKACGEDYSQLRDMLAMVEASPVPERGEEYGREVYLRVLESVEREAATVEVEPAWKSWSRLFQGWNWTTTGAMAMLVVSAFLIGRFYQYRGTPVVVKEAAGPVREKVLLVALGDHLDRSQMVLMELTHTQTIPGVKPQADISAQQTFAEDLIADNRLYRQTALQVGETNVATTLEELERVLIEIANSPSKLNSRELDELQKRIEKEGILFKVRVIGSTVREKDQPSISASAGQGKL